MELTRKKELEILEAFIEKNGVTPVAADERGPDFVPISAWKRSKKSKKKVK